MGITALGCPSIHPLSPFPQKGFSSSCFVWTFLPRSSVHQGSEHEQACTEDVGTDPQGIWELLSLWEATGVSTCCCVLPWHFWYLKWWRQSCDGLFSFTHTLKNTITKLLRDIGYNHPSVMLTEIWCMTDVEFLWNKQRERKEHWFLSLFIWHTAQYLEGYSSRVFWITQSMGKEHEQ